MAKHGKKYLAAAAKVDQDQFYSPEQALSLVKETSYTKFDGTVEVHIRTTLDPRQADQQVRDVVVLPHGLGKTVADDDETFNKIQGGWADFDVAISTPDLMGKVGRLGRVLGPRGLMPNPKAGTVVPAEDLPRAIEQAKAGRVEFRLDKTANIHVQIGKVSFDNKKLTDNLSVLMDAIKKARPTGAKGSYLKTVTLASSMGPGVKVDPNLAQSMEVSG
jgi:large subunit ribosomal protein L1